MSVMGYESAVSFTGAGGVPLAGTLFLPVVGAAPVPAFLLIQGSGPTDRDGNQPPHIVTDLLRQVAALLGSLGIASLRCDKRGMHANAASLPRELPALTAFVSWENFVADAEAALAVLRAQPGIDPGRVGILGHSEGGLIGLSVAARGGAAAPAALVLAATPGRPLAAVLRDQLRRLGRRHGGTGELLAPLLAANDAILAHLIETGDYPAAMPPDLAALYPAYLKRFWRSVAALDPPALAARYPGPVLVVNGAEDVQVLADSDASALRAALSGRAPPAGHRLAILPGASHNLKPVAASPAGGFHGPVHPDLRAVLDAWLAAIGWRAG